MELRTTAPTVKAPADNFTGDVYLNPIFNGDGDSRRTDAMGASDKITANVQSHLQPGEQVHGAFAGQTRNCPQRNSLVSTAARHQHMSWVRSCFRLQL